MAMTYVVKSGDTLNKIAVRFGFPNYHAVYDDPANAAFKAKRPNPNLIYPGDVLAIPDRKGSATPPTPVVPPLPVPPPTPIMPPVPVPPVAPASPRDPKTEALRLRPQPILWVDRAVLAIQALRDLIRRGDPDFLNVHVPTREALRVHFHMDKAEDSPQELDFILNRFKDIASFFPSESDSRYNSATADQERDLRADQMRKQGQPLLPFASTFPRAVTVRTDWKGTIFTQAFLTVSDDCRRVILIHEALHYVEPNLGSPDLVDIGEADPRYNDPAVMPLKKAIHNPSSYAAGAWQLANGSDGARHFCG